MKIGIIGAGHIGGTLARLFSEAGHEVAVSNAHGPESLADLVSTLGPNVHALRIDDAAVFGEVVILAIPWRARHGLPAPETVQGKIVVDAMNPYTPEGGLYDLGDTTSSEDVQARLPGCRLVKAFNTMYYERLAHEGRKDLPLHKRLAIFVAGDDAEAKRVVSQLIEQIGFDPIDTGSLRDGGRRQQPGSPIYNQPITGEQAQRRLKAA